jgi:hypothetical protein
LLKHGQEQAHHHYDEQDESDFIFSCVLH